MSEEVFWDLDGPIVRITTPHVPLPAADALEDAVIPSVERVTKRVAGEPRMTAPSAYSDLGGKTAVGDRRQPRHRQAIAVGLTDVGMAVAG